MTTIARGKLAAIGGLVLLAAVAAWQVEPRGDQAGVALETYPTRVMGTTCHLVAVPSSDLPTAAGRQVAIAALEGAEAEIRAVEAEMSSWIDASPVSRLNQARAGRLVPVPPPTRLVLEASRELYDRSDGAFDVTCRPLIQLWREAGQTQRRPPPDAIEAARRASTWDDLSIEPDGVRKRKTSARVDLGGVAKGYGIDRAVAAMRSTGATGGLVDIGGDVRTFGRPGGATDRWEIQIRNPAGDGAIGTLRLTDGAVCTSGDYFRFVEIEGTRYSHIVDPRTGRPAASVHSATVLASDAMTADGWATALSVLGEAGLGRLPAGVEGLIILGEGTALRAVVSSGFRRQLADPLAYPTREVASK